MSCKRGLKVKLGRSAFWERQIYAMLMQKVKNQTHWCAHWTLFDGRASVNSFYIQKSLKAEKELSHSILSKWKRQTSQFSMAITAESAIEHQTIDYQTFNIYFIL